MRDARSEAVREVHFRPFELGNTHVTGDQWTQVQGTDPMRRPGANIPLHPVTWFAAVHWCNSASLAAGLEPSYTFGADSVIWNVAAEGYRLPTEAEWEFAARAGTSTPTHGPLADIAWTSADGLNGPQSVALKASNALGLSDMIGNAWEWCWDHADTARYGGYRSLRGGGWDDNPWSCRASVRRGSAPDAVLEDAGFRVARGAVGSRMRLPRRAGPPRPIASAPMSAARLPSVGRCCGACCATDNVSTGTCCAGVYFFSCPF